MRAAWAAGVRYFDTAPLYGHGLSERRLGSILRSEPRDSSESLTGVLFACLSGVFFGALNITMRRALARSKEGAA